MIYFKFKQDFFDYKNNVSYVKDELVTEKEFLRKKYILNYDELLFIEKIELPKNKTYFFFGARLEKTI